MNACNRRAASRFGAHSALLLPALVLVVACSMNASAECPAPDHDQGALGPIGACTSNGVSSGGTGSAAGSGATSTGGASQYANFATMTQIVQAKCGGSGCHNAGGQVPTIYGADNASLYATLTTYVVKDCGNRVLVKPGDPQGSAFYLVQQGLCGSPDLPQMPLGCSVDTCTPADYLEGVRQWIANGAPRQ